MEIEHAPKVPRVTRIETYRGNGMWSFYERDEDNGIRESGTMEGDEPRSEADHTREYDEEGNLIE